MSVKALIWTYTVVAALVIGVGVYATWPDWWGTARAKASAHAADVCRPSVAWCLWVVPLGRPRSAAASAERQLAP
jgi:hypothetical protein